MTEMRKLSFSVERDEGGYPPVDVESIWVKPVTDHLYEVDSIPFFTREATVGDVILAREDASGNLWFQELDQRSTHSLIRVVFFDHDCEDNVIEKLRALGCSTERMQQFNLVAVDVPGNVALEQVQEFLHEQSSDGRIDYEEALLRH